MALEAIDPAFGCVPLPGPAHSCPCVSASFSIRRCEDSRRFHDRERAEDKRHVQAVLTPARRRGNVPWALLRDGRTYDALLPTVIAT
ncbi:hypothetical protein GCM10010266_73870 [Streptomyces griseomycini]|nr:hypothetical protein GCM10010266_73870 [Streptomyces griseomycini]GGR62076.1 hypothetical protein GCM10015536_77320 [Streptomyces griseomycini]